MVAQGQRHHMAASLLGRLLILSGPILTIVATPVGSTPPPAHPKYCPAVRI